MGFGRLVCCTDFSPQSEAAFDAAVHEARLHGAQLALLHVVTPGLPLAPGHGPKNAQGLDDREVVRVVRSFMEEQYLGRTGGLDCRIVLRRGHPSVEILACLAELEADLAVMGSQGLSGMGLIILGSVADRVIRRAPCSCLVVRRPG